MRALFLTIAAALLFATAAGATEPGKPMSSDPHGTPMPADKAGDNGDAMMTDEAADDSDANTVGAEDLPKTRSSDPHPDN